MKIKMSEEQESSLNKFSKWPKIISEALNMLNSAESMRNIIKEKC